MKTWQKIAAAYVLYKVYGPKDKPKKERKNRFGGEPISDGGATLCIATEDFSFPVSLEDEDTADDLFEAIGDEELEFEIKKVNSFAAFIKLPVEVKVAPDEIDAVDGDIVLLEGNRVAICFGEGTLEGELLGTIDEFGEDELEQAFGRRGTKITVYLE